MVNTLKSAKFRQKSREGQAFGKAPSRIIKTAFLVLCFIGILLVVEGPLLPFSSLFENSEVYEIKSSKVKINFLASGGMKLGTIFESNLMINTRTIDFKNDTQWAYLDKSEKFRTTNAKYFKRVQISPYSQTFHEFKLTMDHYDTNPVSLEDALKGGEIVIDISFTVNYIFYSI